MKVTGAILVGIMILGGCAEGKRARGQQKYNGYQDYRKGHPVKHAENLNAALVGIDLPSFRPYGTGTTISSQPGIKYQIFKADLNTNTAVTHMGNGQCEVTEETDYYRTFEENVNGMETFSSKHYGTQIGYARDISFKTDSGVFPGGEATSAMTIPPPFVSSNTANTTMSELQEEYEDSSKSKTISYSKCLKYTVYIHNNDNLKFSPNFLEAVKKIERGSTIFEQDEAARELLDDYGTHYAQEVHMGSALTIEKTFDQTLAAVYTQEEIDKCVHNSVSIDSIGRQFRSDTRECDNLWTSMNSEEEVLKETMKIYSIGCAPQDSTDEWLDNLSTDASQPAPIEWRNFRPISELLGLKGITDHLVDGGKGLTKVKAAVWRAYDDYCKIYRVEDDEAGKNQKKKKKMMTGARCEIGCPKQVHFTWEDKNSAKLVQPDDLRVHNGRILYKEDKEDKDSWLFYSRGHWYFGPDIGNPDTANYESMMCPLKGHKMLNMDYVKIDGSDVNSKDEKDWTECSDKCARLRECNHWQYDQENQKCHLVKSFGTFKAVQKSMISSIETVTADKEDADTGDKIQIEIKCGDEKCQTTLDNKDKTKFKRDATDKFTGNMIDNCNKLTCSTDLKMKLINKGEDDWSPKSTRVIFEDGTKCEKFWGVTLSQQSPETDLEVAPCDPPLVTGDPNKVAAGHRKCNPRGPAPTLFNMCPDNNEVTFMWRNKKKGAFYNPEIGLGVPVDCKWGQWNEWGSCTSLGTSYPPCYQVRTRKKIQEARNEGKECEDSAAKVKVKSKSESEKRQCYTGICNNVKTATSCEQENDEYTELKCDDTAEAIQIQSVFYGMKQWNDNDNGDNPPCVKNKGCKDTTCSAGSYAKDWVQFQWKEASGKVVGAGCEGANYCRFQVNDEMVESGNMCDGCHKFAEIKYKCVRTATHQNERVSEYTKVTAQCPVGEVISVQNPVIFKSYFCDYNPLEQGAAYEALNEECEGKQSCDFKPRVNGNYANDHFSDVCNGKNKELTWNYKCGTSVQKCEGGDVDLKCPTGTVIVIKDAFWGKDDKRICRHDPSNEFSKWVTNCGTGKWDRQKTRGAVQYICDGKRECHLEATNEFIGGHRKGGDPCSGTRKYLKVEYGCEEGFQLDHGAKRIQMKDNEKMILRCPNEDEKIKINWPVIYENAELCPINPLNRQDAHKGIAELCEEKNKCEFTVGPDLPHFHDPCRANTNKLTVYWRCAP